MLPASSGTLDPDSLAAPHHLPDPGDTCTVPSFWGSDCRTHGYKECERGGVTFCIQHFRTPCFGSNTGPM
jgi:hypothetical protein